MNEKMYKMSEECRQTICSNGCESLNAIDGYQSPIEIIRTQMRMEMENGILKAVQDVGINVNKDDLLKALAYDRDQYRKGYADGQKAWPGWIHVTERLPEDYHDVLVSLGDIVDVGFHRHRYGWECYSCKKRNDVTHWMPLPSAPEEVRNG